MEQYTLPIMRYTNEIWDILYPEASKDEWSWMNNVHSSADAAIIQMQMARQSAHYPKKLGKVQFVVIDQEFFQWIGMTIHEWGRLSLGRKSKDMQKYFHQLTELDMQRLLEKNHMDQDHRMYVYRFRTENMLPNLCELPTNLKELLTDCLKLRVDGKPLYLPGICFPKDFHGLEFTIRTLSGFPGDGRDLLCHRCQRPEGKIPRGPKARGSESIWTGASDSLCSGA